MDENASMDASIIKGCFDNGMESPKSINKASTAFVRHFGLQLRANFFCVFSGLMGIEIKQDWGGMLWVKKLTKFHLLKNKKFQIILFQQKKHLEHPNIVCCDSGMYLCEKALECPSCRV